MPRKITRFSPRKHFGRRTKRRKAFNLEKHKRYSLNSRVIKKRVEKDLRLFMKHSSPLCPVFLDRLKMKIMRMVLETIHFLVGVAAFIKDGNFERLIGILPPGEDPPYRIYLLGKTPVYR